MSAPEGLRKLASANLENARAYFRAQIDDLSEAAAEASSTFAMAPPEKLIAASMPFLENLDQYLDDLEKRVGRDAHDAERERLGLMLQPARAYTRGYIEGGAVYVAILMAFPEGDWDDPSEVKKVLHTKLAFVANQVDDAFERWLDNYSEPTAAPAAAASPLGSVPPTEEASRPAAAAPQTPADRLESLLTFADSIGVRIKKVPANPSETWVDKLEAKLKQVAKKKGVPFELPEIGGALGEEDIRTATAPLPADQATMEGDDRESPHTAAAPQPLDPEAEAERRERIEAMLKKAEKAELKLGRIPDAPTDEWIEETEAKLKAALEKRKAKRKAERERKAAQRKARIDRLQKNASSVGVDLGKIPPFPTEDWIARSEMRVVTEMLKQMDAGDGGTGDSGRAERLTSLLAKAAEVGVELDVPPDPDMEWIEWAEGRVAEAEEAEEPLMAGEEERTTPVLIYEEGTIQEQVWPLEGVMLTIGRTRKNQVPLPHDAQVSRTHCKLWIEDETWMVEDLQSTRGTHVNEQQISSPWMLNNGDVIRVGDTVLVVRGLA